MTDIFAKARAMGQANPSAAARPIPGPTHASPGKGQAPVASQPQAAGNFQELSKKFGLGDMKLNANPVVARTQLLQHLQTKLGPNYMSHPGVSDMLEAFNQGSTLDPKGKAQANAAADGNNVKSLLG